jgi:LPXTG-motif cell wall-anchored protein
MAIPPHMLFLMIGMEMGLLQTEARPTGAQCYIARASFVPMGGRWHMTVVLRRAGFADVQHTFEMDILRAAGGSPPTLPRTGDGDLSLMGAIALAALIMLAGGLVLRWSKRRG